MNTISRALYRIGSMFSPRFSGKLLVERNVFIEKLGAGEMSLRVIYFNIGLKDCRAFINTPLDYSDFSALGIKDYKTNFARAISRISFADAQKVIASLKDLTGVSFRLPSLEEAKLLVYLMGAREVPFYRRSGGVLWFLTHDPEWDIEHPGEIHVQSTKSSYDYGIITPEARSCLGEDVGLILFLNE